MRQTRLQSLYAVLVCAVLAGCAGGMSGPEVKPEDIPALEAQTQQNPRDVDGFTRLGIGYYNAKNWTRAADALRAAVTLDKTDYRALVYLGLTEEELGAYDSARVVYGSARTVARSNAQRAELDNRLVLLTRREMLAAAQQAVAQESTLAVTPPEPNTVAVLPFRYAGSDTTLQPLGRGLTQLVVNDLGKVARLKLLERERVQALVDEMKLTESGRVDPATGARSGRLLRADQVVQGTLQDAGGSADQKRLDANVVSTTTAQVTASGNATDQLQQIFDAEKSVVFQLLDRMGITLTPAEQQSIQQQPTKNLAAFLAFSRGLQAEDNGDFAAAARDFNAAAAADPGFQAAKASAAKSAQMSQAQSTPAPQLAGGGAPPGPNGGLLQLSNSVTPSFGGGVNNQLGGSNPPLNRPPVPESLGDDNVIGGQLGGTIVIVIPRP